MDKYVITLRYFVFFFTFTLNNLVLGGFMTLLDDR